MGKRHAAHGIGSAHDRGIGGASFHRHRDSAGASRAVAARHRARTFANAANADGRPAHANICADRHGPIGTS